MSAEFPSLHVLETLCEPGAYHNEDRVFHDGPTTWVVDGATSLTKSRRTSSASDAVWLVDKAVTALEGLSHESLTAQVRELVRTLESGYPLGSGQIEKFDVPSAVAAGIQMSEAGLGFLHFGDCSLIVLDSEGSELYRSPQSKLRELDKNVIEVMSKLRSDNGLSFVEARQEVLPLLQINRSLSNTTRGYGNISVFGDNPQPHTSGSLKVSSGAFGLVGSDGFMALVDDYHHYTPQELVKSAKQNGLRELYGHLRKIEEADADCLTFPRLKARDDASAILFEIL